MSTLHQEAPYPLELRALLKRLQYKQGWNFELTDIDRGQGSIGLTLTITITTPNSYHPDQVIRVAHLMPVPPAAYDQRSWQRWLFDQILLVERHEACEFFTLVTQDDFITLNGEQVSEWRYKPYAPSHGPGNDPYMIREVGTNEDRRTSFRGELNS